MTYQIREATITILRGDITRQDTDAIVNAANSSLMGGGGVDGAIHRAGGPAILEECRKIVAGMGRLPTGRAVITTAGNMPARYVIHTVGPIWYNGNKDEPGHLSSAYRESLKLAAENDLPGVAFPSISTGAYGYPLNAAAQIALRTVVEFLASPSPLREVRFVLFNTEAYEAYAAALEEIKSGTGS